MIVLFHKEDFPQVIQLDKKLFEYCLQDQLPKPKMDLDQRQELHIMNLQVQVSRPNKNKC